MFLGSTARKEESSFDTRARLAWGLFIFSPSTRVMKCWLVDNSASRLVKCRLVGESMPTAMPTSIKIFLAKPAGGPFLHHPGSATSIT